MKAYISKSCLESLVKAINKENNTNYTIDQVEDVMIYDGVISVDINNTTKNINFVFGEKPQALV